MARILIIDDDEIIRDYLRVILEDNHIIHEARDGEEGIDLYRKHFFDLVITDILMPARDGIEVIVEITDSFPDARIIAISGGGRGLEASFNLEMAKKCGAMRVLKKPFFPEDMRIAVSDVLANRTQSADNARKQGLLGFNKVQRLLASPETSGVPKTLTPLIAGSRLCKMP
ncbi:MAG: response regulator [Magnetococcales bacterium]|nr:response regulator [Magnetococcales bacterium]